MNKILKVLVVVGISIMVTGGLFANGLNLNGVGSKGSAMGTAGIGLANDWSAVFFNPAGLTQMKNASISLFITDIVPSGTYNFEMLGTTMADAKTETMHYPSGALAYYKPINDKLVVGIAGYVPSGVGSKWNGDDFTNLTGGTSYAWNSTVFMITVSPVAAYKLSDKLSIGASLNINYARIMMERPGGDGANMPFFQYEEDLSGIALGATLGIMYKASDVLSIGATFKTPIKASVSGNTKAPIMALLGFPTESEGERSATWPMWAGVGIAVKPTDKLTLIFDVSYNNWGNMQNIPITFSEASWGAMGMEEGSEFTLKWDDTVDVKFGVEYWISEILALRAGYYTDLSPSPDETLNIMLPSISYKALTFGFGYKTGKMNVDFAVEFLTGDDRFVDPMNYYVDAGMPGTHGMKMIVPNVTFTYNF
jgi:long-chain fatty acid transport protein